MKRFRVKVNEKEYLVEVSEEGVESIAQSAPVTAARNNTESTARPVVEKEETTEGGVRAPIAGKILRIAKREGEEVKRDDVILVLEAMKMENEIYAPKGGKIKKLHVKEGENVEEGQVLCDIE